jgi:phosphoglycolate phosphatase-like HAD superfamily hydrolase
MSEQLSLWNDTPSKQAILDFVEKVTNPNNAAYVLPEERIATFDCDGTLWCEKPVQIQIAWILQEMATMAKKDPSLRTGQPFKAAYEKDNAWFGDTVTKHYKGDDSGMKVLLGGVGKAYGERTVEAFEAQAAEFLKTEQHPTYHVSYLEMTYQPMVELLDYLTANGFTPYIVSGGGRDFMRPVTQQLYDIPPERVIGSDFVESFQADDNGAHIMRGNGINIVDDGPAKAVNIWNHIGRRPILAAGNANGDIPMLQFAGGEDRPALRLLVNHDDAARETDYTAGAEKAIKLAKDQGWTVVSMKQDWKRVFSFQGRS